MRLVFFFSLFSFAQVFTLKEEREKHTHTHLTTNKDILSAACTTPDITATTALCSTAVTLITAVTAGQRGRDLLHLFYCIDCTLTGQVGGTARGGQSVGAQFPPSAPKRPHWRKDFSGAPTTRQCHQRSRELGKAPWVRACGLQVAFPHLFFHLGGRRLKRGHGASPPQGSRLSI